MSETAKTISFLAIGLVAVAIGLMTRPSSAELDVASLVNQDLTKNFTSVDDAKRLRIVRFDEDTATLREFEVAEEDGLWSIPSKDGYPADASRQMAEAATSLMDRKILRIESQSAGDHEQFGVIDPLSPKLEVGQKGVGARVTMSDDGGDALVDLIIGKSVKGAEGQRYVREAGRDVVYVIEIDPAKLSTSFEDWIEKDLLKLNPWDLAQVEIKDYSAELIPAMSPDGRLAIQVAWDPRAEMTVAYDESKGAWTAERLAQFDPATESQAEFTLAEDEELNETSLNGLKDALDDLAIVDVVRKPQGLSDDLKAGGDFLNNPEAQRDLMRRGFVTAGAAGSDKDEIISSDGEVIATLKDGTEYVLRFGNLTNVAGPGESPTADSEEDLAGDDENKPTGESDVHRYLFVMARFNENSVDKPALEDLPELPAGAPATEKEAAPTGDEPAVQEEAAPAEEAADAAGEKPATAEEEAKTQETAEGTGEAPADEAASTSEEAATDETAPADDESAANDEAAAKEEGADEATPTDDSEPKSAELEKIIADRKRIETENQRKLDEYQATLTKGQNNVKDLNARFGDWYFVVANDTFNKVRLSKDDVVKKKEAPANGAPDTGVDASAAGTPGAAIPGLPTIPGAGE